MLPKISKIAVLFLGMFLFANFTPRAALANTKLFFDDFSSGNLEKWTVAYNSCKYNNQQALWKVLNQTLSISINGGPCATFLIPNSTPILSGKDYFTETLIEFSTSLNMDRNYIVKYKDLANWYGLHFLGNNVYLDKVVEGKEYFLPQRLFSYPFILNQTYKVKVAIIGDIFTIYINDELVKSIQDLFPTFQNTTAGLAASAGSIPSSVVGFDNFLIEQIDDNLIIPLPSLKQGGDGVSWGNEIYNNYLPTDTTETIRKWGCYLTSASMLLQAYNFDIDPSELNSILKSNGGYTIFHGVDLSALAAYTKNLSNTKHLEYKYYNFDYSTLDSELSSGRPVIVKLQGPALPYGTHFVVVKGKENNEYLINDPEPTSTKTKLSEYDSALYSHIRTLVPVSTDFSYINVFAPKNVTPRLFDSTGTEITGFSYVEGPIEADDMGGSFQGEPVNVFSFPKPPDGNYELKFAGDGVYKAQVRAYEDDGDIVETIINDVLDTGQEDQVGIQISDINSVSSETTFESVLQNLYALHENGLFLRDSAYKLIKLEITLAKYFYEKNVPAYKSLLSVAKKHTEKLTKNEIDPAAKEILISGINELLKI